MASKDWSGWQLFWAWVGGMFVEFIIVIAPLMIMARSAAQRGLDAPPPGLGLFAVLAIGVAIPALLTWITAGWVRARLKRSASRPPA